jgi:CBS domain-containing protein
MVEPGRPIAIGIEPHVGAENPHAAPSRWFSASSVSAHSDAGASKRPENRRDSEQRRLTMTTSTANPLADVSVAAAMHPGVLTCPPETPLRDVARMLALYNVHSVFVHLQEDQYEEGVHRLRVVSDLDLVSAAAAGDLDDRTAGGSAAEPVVEVSGRDTLQSAARLMKEHRTSHLVVVEPDTMRPVGVLSTLDLAAALAGLEVGSGPPRLTRH